MKSQPAWDPGQYARFEAERDRAAIDLLVRLPADLEPRVIWDLGCGSGRHAALLKRRYPEAAVFGLDSSPAMIDQAERRPEAVDWRLGRIEDWAPEEPVDLIYANASLHWLPNHAALFDRLARALSDEGVLAVQMPLAHETPHHALMRETAAADGPWKQSLAYVSAIAPLLAPRAYYDVLARACGEVDIWSTTYLHALTGPEPVLEWMKGTALRPYLEALEPTPWRDAYLEALSARLSRAFPARADGVTLLPFPRLFLVARRTDVVSIG